MKTINFYSFLLGVLHLSYAAPSLVQERACTPTTLANGNFESGSLKPWTVSAEYVSVSKAATISTNKYQGKYAAKLTVVYSPSNKPNGQAPLVNLSQDVNSCGAPLTLSLYYKIMLNPQYDNSFLTQIYDSSTKEVYVYKYITFNDTATIDSEGSAYGQWHKLTTSFQPHSSFLIFSFIIDGDYHGHDGTSSVLVDNVSLVTTPA